MPLFEEALGLCRALLSCEYPDLSEAACDLGRALLAVGRPGEAAAHFPETVEFFRQTHGDHREDLPECLEMPGEALEEQGDPDAAEPRFAEAADLRASLDGQDDDRQVTQQEPKESTGE